MKYILGLLLLLVVVVISITLGAQNAQAVEFNFLIARGTYSFPVLLSVLFGGGLIFGWLLAGVFYLRCRYRLRGSERKVKLLQKQLDKIQSPHKDTPASQPAVKE